MIIISNLAKRNSHFPNSSPSCFSRKNHQVSAKCFDVAKSYKLIQYNSYKKLNSVYEERKWKKKKGKNKEPRFKKDIPGLGVISSVCRDCKACN